MRGRGLRCRYLSKSNHYHSPVETQEPVSPCSVPEAVRLPPPCDYANCNRMRQRVIVIALAIVAIGCPGAASRAPAPQAALRLDSADEKRAAFVQAYEAFRRGDGGHALPIFTALTTSYPELADYHLYYIGTIQARSGHDPEAEATFARLLRGYPQSVKAPT